MEIRFCRQGLSWIREIRGLGNLDPTSTALDSILQLLGSPVADAAEAACLLQQGWGWPSSPHILRGVKSWGIALERSVLWAAGEDP